LHQENLMRYDRNFNPEWGYAAPTPSVMRAARLIVVAAIIGATAGAATVFFVAGSADGGRVGCSTHFGSARLRAPTDSQHVGRVETADRATAGQIACGSGEFR
jgi:hypothetical protein